MATVISATELKNMVSEVLNKAYFNGTETLVKRYGKPIVKIIPIKERKRGKEEIRNALDATFGSLPDFPNVTKFRRSGRRKIPPLSP